MRILYSLLLCGLTELARCRISCKGMDGESVDWFVAYKLPTGVNGSDGQSFIYADGKNPMWRVSKKSVAEERSAIGATISQVYSKDSSAFRFLYNDDPPGSRGADSYRGHAKGVLLFDQSTGFWLTHSVPNFPPLKSYSYPTTAVKFAQSFMCVTVDTNSLNSIGDHMRFIQATPFDFGLPETFASRFPILRTITQKKSLSKSETAFTTMKQLSTVGGVHFTSFAKHKKFNKDLWLDLVVPSTHASVGVQSWLNGGADDLKSKCSSGGSVYDIEEINLLGSTFSSSKDHSKWAVSDDARVPLVCVGDLNRQKSQLKRGGGAICIEDKTLWRTYRETVGRVATCSAGSGPTPDNFNIH